MTRSKIWLISLVFILLDAVIVCLSFLLATLLRKVLADPLGLAPVSWNTVIDMSQLGMLFVVGLFLFQNLYPGYGLTAVKELEQMSKAISLAFILLTALSYLVRSFIIFPRTICGLAWLISLILLPIFRFVMRNILSRTKIYGIPVIVFGEGQWAKDVTNSLHRIRRLGWRPVSTIPILNFDTQNNEKLSSIAVLAYEHDFPLAQKIRELSQRFHKVVVVEETNNYGSLWVEIRDLDSFMGLEYQYHLLSVVNNWIKKVIDIFGALILLILLSPLMIIVSILIKIDSRGPILYRQERLGRNFTHISMYKFRSMVPDADQRLKDLLDNNPSANALYKKYHKIENDPRVTKIGRFIRRFSIDEFPQLFNVLKGEMSLSGPRAYLPSEQNDMGSYAATILRVNPGMTGWWQVLGRHNTSFQKRLQMDEYYISNWSIWMDLYIFLKTVGVVIFGKGM